MSQPVNQDIRYGPPTGKGTNPESFIAPIAALRTSSSFIVGSGVPSELSVNNIYIDENTGEWYKVIDNVITKFYEGDPGSVVDSAINVGAGEGLVFKSLNVDQLEFKTLKEGSNITITNNADEIVLDVPDSISGGANTGVGNGVYLNNTLDIMNFKSLVAGSNISIDNNPFDISISAPSVITGGSNSGLPAATQVYSGILGNSLRFKPFYSTSADLLRIGYSLDGQNIEVKSLNKWQYQGTLSNVGSANSTIYWATGIGVSPAISSSLIVDDVSKKLYKFTAKLVYDTIWTNTAGTMSFDIGYFSSGLPVSAGNFVTLVSIGFPNNTPNPNIVWSAGVNTYLIPTLGGLAVRFTTVGAVNTATNADICVSVQVIDA